MKRSEGPPDRWRQGEAPPRDTAERSALVVARDMAGTPASDADGRFFGEVYGVLADADTGLIRYLDLDVHGADRHVLVPIGHVHVPRVVERPAEVQLRAATAGDLSAIPPYDTRRGPPPDVDQRALLTAHRRVFSGERYYAHPAYDHSGLYAGERPVLSGPAAPAGAPLARLSEMPDYRIVQGSQDIRGWPLLARDDEAVGEVADLVADPAALRLRYALVRLDDQWGQPGPDQVLLPVGMLERQPADARVRLPALSAAEVRALPRHRGPIRRTDEDEMRRALDRILDGPRRFDGPDFRGGVRVQRSAG